MERLMRYIAIFIATAVSFPMTFADNATDNGDDILTINVPYIYQYQIDKRNSTAYTIEKDNYVTMTSGSKVLREFESYIELYTSANSNLNYLKDVYESGKFDAILSRMDEDANQNYQTMYESISYIAGMTYHLQSEMQITIREDSIIDTRVNSSHKDFNADASTYSDSKSEYVETPFDSVYYSAENIKRLREVYSEIESFNSKLLDFNTKYNDKRQKLTSILKAGGINPDETGYPYDIKDFPENLKKEFIELYDSTGTLSKEIETYLDIMDSYGSYIDKRDMIRSELADIIGRGYDFASPISELENYLQIISEMNLDEQLTKNVIANNYTFEIPGNVTMDGEELTVSSTWGVDLIKEEISDNPVTIILPENITGISDSFSNLYIDKIIIKAKVPPFLFASFTTNYNYNREKTLVYVPDESLNDYISKWRYMFMPANILPISQSAVSSITDDVNTGECEPEVFTLQGVKIGKSIDNLPKGIYILRQGNSSQKIRVD